jgi:hypothetical protein
MEGVEHCFLARWEIELFIDNLLVRIHFIIEMIWWTSLAPSEFEFPFPRQEGTNVLLGDEEGPLTGQKGASDGTERGLYRDTKGLLSGQKRAFDGTERGRYRNRKGF